MVLLLKIQEFDGQSRFSNVRYPTQRMVYCEVVSRYLGPITVVEDHILERGYITRYEIKSLTGWRNWCKNDANLVTTFQPYIANSGYQ